MLRILAGFLALVAPLHALACTGRIAERQDAARGSTELSAAAQQRATDSSFARLIERLSEPAGYFDSDNLISNEASYLHVVDKMTEMGVSGGAYIGVGPDQSFSYIAHVRPTIAFIIDIRRDNLLQHFLFKSLFALAENRIEYLCLLLGRPIPDDAAQWNDRTIEELTEYLDRTPADPGLAKNTRASIVSTAMSFGLPLSESDLATIGRIHASFATAGLGLRFTSLSRPPRSFYPTFRNLLLERDLTGHQANYLASEADFQFVKSLEERDLIIPVVGDLAGDHALRAIGRLLTARGEHVSTFYTSNVEFYLMRQGSFDRFADNVAQLPMDERSVIIRSFFNRNWRYPHPQAVPGYYSTQLLQTMESLVMEHSRGGYRTYWDLVSRHLIDLR